MKLTFRQGYFIGFSLLWVVLLLLDYYDKHNIYSLSIENFRYTGLTLLVTAIGGGLAYLHGKRQKPILNGLMLWGLSLFMLLAAAIAFNQYFRADLTSANYLHLLGMSTYTFLGGVIVTLSAYALGQMVIPRLDNGFVKSIGGISAFLIYLCIGFLLLTLLLFVVGALGLLTQIVVLAILLVPIAVNYKASLSFLKRAFWDKIQLHNVSGWGIFLGVFLLFVLMINFMYTQSPFPLGFDARTYYVNISKLISEHGGLVSGYQPYPWTLLNSVGYTAFQSMEVTLFLSTIGGILSCGAIYELGTRYLKVSGNFAIAACLLFCLTPAVVNHWNIEYKVDLALLLVQLTSICLLLWRFFELTDDESEGYTFWVVLGLLLGFSLSIKVLSIFLAFGVFLIPWWRSKSLFGALGLSALIVGLMIIIGLDNISGLRDYHDSPRVTGAIIAVLGLGLFVLSFIKERDAFLKNIKHLTIVGVVMLLVFSPWVAKNYMNHPNNRDLMTLIVGKSPNPPTTVGDIKNNYDKATGK